MWDSIEDAFERLKQDPKAQWAGYAGFYSSWLGGYFREPWAMTVPMDDHGFHRGDGVFEAVRIHEGAYFDLQSHLKRLMNSAARVGIVPFRPLEDMKGIVLELARRCEMRNGILRLYMTRGPGGFSPNPEECTGTELYAAITAIKTREPEKYLQGVSCMVSATVAKDPFYSEIKSLNYLQNVLMRRECRDQGYDFGVCVDSAGRVCEGATENLIVLTSEMELVVPRFDYTLRGTTVTLVMKIAEELAAELGLKAVRFGDISVEHLKAAREVAFVGTTLGVLPVSAIDRVPVGSGRGGTVALRLNEVLMEHMASDPTVRTPF